MEIHIEKRQKNTTDTPPGAAGGESCCRGGEPGAQTPACQGGCGCRPDDSGSCGRVWHQASWKMLAALLGLFLATLVVAKVVELKKTWSLAPAGLKDRTIALSASGKAAAVPDAAEVQLSVLTEGLTPREVQQENTRKMNEVIAFTKSLGIVDKDVRTAAYTLYPKYEYLRGKSEITGYAINQSLRLVVRDATKIGVLLEGTTQRGINQIGDVRFFVDDPEKFRDEARREALAKVQRKAKDVAALAGVSIGRLISFSELSQEHAPIIYGESAYAPSLERAAAAPPQIEPGTQDIIVTVSATYTIE